MTRSVWLDVIELMGIAVLAWALSFVHPALAIAAVGLYLVAWANLRS